MSHRACLTAHVCAQVRSVGTGIESIMPHIVNQPIDEMFMISRPLIEFNIENVSFH